MPHIDYQPRPVPGSPAPVKFSEPPKPKARQPKTPEKSKGRMSPGLKRLNLAEHKGPGLEELVEALGLDKERYHA